MTARQAFQRWLSGTRQLGSVAKAKVLVEALLRGDAAAKDKCDEWLAQSLGGNGASSKPIDLLPAALRLLARRGVCATQVVAASYGDLVEQEGRIVWCLRYASPRFQNRDLVLDDELLAALRTLAGGRGQLTAAEPLLAHVDGRRWTIAEVQWRMRQGRISERA